MTNAPRVLNASRFIDKIGLHRIARNWSLKLAAPSLIAARSVVALPNTSAMTIVMYHKNFAAGSAINVILPWDMSTIRRNIAQSD
jgi:hypothetical protein